ncbi:hypothetical protein ABZ626_09210 [Streptomyces longispororuber]|uniref:hypothetical protein n=1 Tax=Streptomyces longispororuber TaxID=68230 RepID=UPI0033F00053
MSTRHAPVPGDGRPQMPVEDFEDLVRSAPETVRNRLVFTEGRLEVEPLPDGVHGAVVMLLLRQCVHQRPEWCTPT